MADGRSPDREMSWAEEDWTVGLSGRVLQKVKELQVQQERLSRDSKQKQLQLDNVHTGLQRQTAKYEEARAQLHSVHRELQKVREEAAAAVSGSEGLAQELQARQAQVCSLEGQLDAGRTLNSKLSQEVKRLEAELEKLQNSSRLGDTTLFSTPCWSTPSPWEHSGSRKEGEEELGRPDQAQSRHSRQRLQFSDLPTASLPRPQSRSTPPRHPSDQSQSFSTPSAVFPWERDDTRPTDRRQSPTAPQTPCAAGLCGTDRDHRTQGDRSEVKGRLCLLEEELSLKARTVTSMESELAQSRKAAAAGETSLQRARDELSVALARIGQESERAAVTEQRLRQVQDELRCQRQNAESSRLQHIQRTKELERQHQRETLEAHRQQQFVEKQHEQELNQLSQELQEARTLHGALQVQSDQLTLRKQALDKEVDTLKETLKWTEGQLLESQRQEAQTQAKLTDALREAEGVAVSMEQSRRRERSLEEEGRRLAEERADALRLLRDLQAPPPQAVHSCSPQPSNALHSPSRRTTSNTREEEQEQEQEQEEEEEEDTPEMTASCPADREPGEGIDSEHISCSQSEGSHGEGRKRKDEDTTRTHQETEAPAGEDLQRQNAALRSEINDVREELRKRLEDLDGQRRAEAEARSRLKQLRRKHCSLAAAQEEQDKEWRTQLDRERAETERLRRAVAALEAEVREANVQLERRGSDDRKELSAKLAEVEAELEEGDPPTGRLHAAAAPSQASPLPEGQTVIGQARRAQPSPSDQGVELHRLQERRATSPDLEEELTRLSEEKAQETQRAQQSQEQLQALQSQVTRQTLQLTTAFEKQSQHISCLLAELQQKEGALLSQAEELQRCQRELRALRAQKQVPEGSDDDWRERMRPDHAEDLVVAAQTERDGTKSEAETDSCVCSACATDGGHDAGEPPTTSDGPLQNTRGQRGGRGTRDKELGLLQQQVGALQVKVRALTAQTQQQTQELAMWRLASRPPPSFDHITQHAAAAHPRSQQPEDMSRLPPGAGVPAPAAQVQERSSSVTVLREDEVLLSCSSNEPGRTLLSSLQHGSRLRPKSVAQPAVLQEESEKENFESPSDARDAEANPCPQAAIGPSQPTAAKPNAPRTCSEPSDTQSVSCQTEDSWVPPSAPERLSAHAQTEDEEEESPPVSPATPLKEAADSVLFSGSFPIPADPARLAERIRRNRTQLSAAFDDTEYEPYGLPEVVMKGFADIPSGPSCPYIVRRGLLGTSVVPVQQKDLGQEEETD